MKIVELFGSLDLYTRAINIIKNLPNDEVLTGAELADKLGVLKSSGHAKTAFSKLVNNRAKVRIQGGEAWVYGTNVALKKLQTGITSENQ